MQRLHSYYLAAKHGRKFAWRGPSRSNAKSMRQSARKHRRNDAKPFVISTDAYPWAF